MAQRLEKIIAAVSPSWALKRERSRLELAAVGVRREFVTGYAAAERNRLTKDYDDTSLSADQAIVDHTPRLNARARAAVMNHWAGASGVSAYRRHVVGSGITSRANARDPETGDAFEDFNRDIDRLWNRWVRDRTLCDVERRKTFNEMQSLGVSEFCTVGQCFFVWSYTPHRVNVGLKIQVFETEQLAWDKFQKFGPGSNDIKGGIEVDSVGSPLAYHFHTGEHPLEAFGSDPVRVPADRVYHLMRQDRARQTHGVTRLAPVLLQMHHLANYDLNHVVRARMEACIGAVIEQSAELVGTNLGVAPPAEDTDHPTDDRGNVRIRFEPGMAPRLAPGETMNFNTPTGVGGNYAAFTDQQIVQISAGMGLDHPTLTRDFRKGTFSGQRQGLIERNSETDPIQNLMVDLLCRPVREWFTTLAIMEGRVEAPGFMTDPEIHAAYLEMVHQGPPKPWIDPLKQAQAAALSLATRLTTRRDITNELGGNEAEVLRQIANEEALAEELGVSLPESSSGSPAATPPTNEPDDPEIPGTDEPDEAEELAAATYGGPTLGNNGVGAGAGGDRWTS